MQSDEHHGILHVPMYALVSVSMGTEVEFLDDPNDPSS